MKIKAINKNAKQQFNCEEIEINGFKYYIIDTAFGCKYGISKLNEIVEVKMGYDATLYKGIICSNNPNIDIPKVVDEVEVICIKDLQEFYGTDIQLTSEGEKYLSGFKTGYNKSQETHPFSEADMLEFAEWKVKNGFYMYSHEDKWSVKSFSPYYTDANESVKIYTTKELLKLWKEQRPKIVYYEN